MDSVPHVPVSGPKIWREVPVCAFMIHSEGSCVRIVSFRVDSGVVSENSQRTDGDLRVLHEQHVVGYDWSVISNNQVSLQHGTSTGADDRRKVPPPAHRANRWRGGGCCVRFLTSAFRTALRSRSSRSSLLECVQWKACGMCPPLKDLEETIEAFSFILQMRAQRRTDVFFDAMYATEETTSQLQEELDETMPQVVGMIVGLPHKSTRAQFGANRGADL